MIEAPPQEPSAWHEQIEVDSPTVVEPVTVYAPVSPDAEIQARYVAMLEARLGIEPTDKCRVFIPGYDGANPLWRDIFGADLNWPCAGIVPHIPIDLDRPIEGAVRPSR